MSDRARIVLLAADGVATREIGRRRMATRNWTAPLLARALGNIHEQYT